MKKICVNCGKEFECYDKKHKGGFKKSGKGRIKRTYKSVNCSTKCSKEWQSQRSLRKKLK
jgi:hypothetical protein